MVCPVVSIHMGSDILSKLGVEERGSMVYDGFLLLLFNVILVWR